MEAFNGASLAVNRGNVKKFAPLGPVDGSVGFIFHYPGILAAPLWLPADA
jgi:hypothetical protein